MIYKAFQDLDISALGLGAMRLPTKEDNPKNGIDEERVREMVAYAMEHGINYYDTAYGYHEGESERVMGKVLREYPRESFYLADKFPGYDLSLMGRVKENGGKEEGRWRTVGLQSCWRVWQTVR